MAILTIKLPQVGEISHELVGDLVTIGRFPGNTIQIKDPSVSGQHAQLTAIEGGYRLRDLESTNKTYINGLAVGEADLRGSFTIRFGVVECLLTPSPAQSEAETAGSSARADELERALHALQAEHESALAACAQAQAELARTYQDLAETTQRETQAGQALETRRLEMEEAQRAAAALETTFASEKERLEHAANVWREEQAAALKTAEQEKHELARQRDEAQQRADGIQADHEARGEAVENLAAERDELARKSQEAESRAETTRRELQEMLDRLRRELEQLRSEQAKAQENIGVLTAKADEQERSSNNLREQNRELQARRSEFEDLLERERTAKSSAEGMAGDGQRRMEELTLQLERERREGVAAKQAASQMGRRVRELEGVLQETAGDREGRGRDLEEAQQQRQEAQQRAEKLAQELGGLREQAESAQRTSGEAAGKLADTQQQLATLEQELAAARQRDGEANARAEAEREHARQAGAACDEARREKEALAAQWREAVERIAHEQTAGEQLLTDVKQQLEGERLRAGAQEQALSDLRGELEKVRGQLGGSNEAEQERAHLASKLGELEAAHETLRREKAAQDEHWTRLENDTAAQERAWAMEREGFGVRLGEVESRATQAEERVREFEQNRASSGEESTRRQLELEARTKALEEAVAARGRAEEEQTRLAGIVKDFEDQQVRCATLQQERDGLGVRLGEMESRATAAEEQTRKFEENRVTSAEEMARLRQELGETRGAREAARAELEARAQALEEAGLARAQGEEEQTRLAGVVKNFEERQTHFENLEQELAKVRAELETAQQARGAVQEEKARLAREWERWQQEHAEKEKQGTSAAEQNAQALADTRAQLDALQKEHAALAAELKERTASELKNGSQPAEKTLPPPAANAPLPKPPITLPTRPAAEPTRLDNVLSTAPRLSSWLRRGPKGKPAMVDEPPAAEPAPVNGATADSEASAPAVAAAAVAVAVAEAEVPEIDEGTKFSPQFVRVALGDFPRSVMTMRNSLQYFIRHPRDLNLLSQLLGHVQALGKRAEKIPNHPVQRLGHGVEKLVSDLIELPELINKSTLRTLTQSLDFLAVVVEEKNLGRLHNLPAPRVLNVDDEPDISEQVAGALEIARLRVQASDNAAGALEGMKTQRFDLLVLDVNMPGMNGLEMCAKVRSTPNYQKVPIIFLTAAATAQNRAQSLLLGGNDLIAKPFVSSELALKSLMWIYKGQLGLI